MLRVEDLTEGEVDPSIQLWKVIVHVEERLSSDETVLGLPTLLLVTPHLCSEGPISLSVHQVGPVWDGLRSVGDALSGVSKHWFTTSWESTCNCSLPVGNLQRV